jgi:hypothetical protein
MLLRRFGACAKELLRRFFRPSLVCVISNPAQACIFFHHRFETLAWLLSPSFRDLGMAHANHLNPFLGEPAKV